MATRIDSPDDPRLDGYRALKGGGHAEREGRRGLFATEGRLAVEALLRSPYELASLLVDERLLPGAATLVAASEAAGAAVYLAPRDVLRETVGFELHRGVVGLGRRRPLPDPDALVAGVLDPARRQGQVPGAAVAVLEGTNDHENLGALFRNAAAFGVGAVLLDPTCADPLYRRSVRVSLGHVLGVPFARLAAPWPASLVACCERHGLALAALVPGHASPRAEALRSFARRRAGMPVALLLGAEGAGLSPAALAAAGDHVSVPMVPGVDSLNVATAAAIAFYELTTARSPG